MIRVLITGSRGFLGQHLMEELSRAPKLFEPLYFSSEDVDLANDELDGIARWLKPNYVVHLAARVGGIVDNANNQKEFLETNLLINTLVMKTVDELEIPCISLSSSCCYPQYPAGEYPLSESDFRIGGFEPTNYTYALAKSVMMKQIELSTNQHVCLIPCNLVGKYDHFGRPGAHFVPSMITKLVQAQREGKEKITLLGTGESLRQFCDAEDVCEVITNFLTSNGDVWKAADKFLNVGPQRNLSIKEAATIIRDIFAPEIQIEFDGDTKYNGIYRKDISDAKLQRHYNEWRDHEFDYTYFEEAIKKIYDANIVIP